MKNRSGPVQYVEHTPTTTELDMLGGLIASLADIGNYDDRKVDRLDPEDNAGIGISTALTSDEGYETAVLGKETNPVERYASRNEAIEGHQRWVDVVTADGWDRTITKLGGWDMVDDETGYVVQPICLDATG